MRAILWLPLVAALVLIPTRASAVTLEQVVSLAHAGVTDAVILALIDRDRTIFAIEPEQIVTLQREGLSEAVILAMLKSGRDEGDQAARADSAYTAATIAAAISPGPQLLIVGHGPEVPNTAHADGFYSGPPASGFYAFPSQYAYPSFRSRSSFRNNTGQPSVGVRPQSLCFAQVTTRASVSPSLGFVTECPAVMQPRRRP
jgi:hypothetical protein